MQTNISEAASMALSGKRIGFTEYLSIARARIETAIAKIGEIDGAGIVKHHIDNRWQMILPDVSGQGRWRTQSFDLNGFSGHCVFASKDKAIKDAASLRFTERDDEALDRIQDTPEFQTGIYATEQIQLLNRGQIDFKEYTSRLVNYRQRLLEPIVH